MTVDHTLVKRDKEVVDLWAVRISSYYHLETIVQKPGHISLYHLYRNGFQIYRTDITCIIKVLKNSF